MPLGVYVRQCQSALPSLWGLDAFLFAGNKHALQPLIPMFLPFGRADNKIRHSHEVVLEVGKGALLAGGAGVRAHTGCRGRGSR